MFRVGDKVVCIDNKDESMLLINGHIYTITSILPFTETERGKTKTSDGELIFLEIYNKNRGFFRKRFVSLKEYRKQKILCVG